ncbi:MAG: hypothetical protein EA364_08205 [Balneolaceae bacterium]|jgi:hypothetical protein|nr:MAG: hypothetical protein EA364_08205 [Balneolaceae bacterium]
MNTPDSPTSKIKWMEWTIEHPELQQMVQLLKAEWLMGQGRRSEAVSTRMQFHPAGPPTA